MSDGTLIEWCTDAQGRKGATWNVITGCTVVGPGCKNCYAMRIAGTRLRNHPSRRGLTRETRSGPIWNGVVRFNEQWLYQPMQWTRPRIIFTAAHGDLFHQAVTDNMIDDIFGVMEAATHHSYRVLTKRAARMRDYLTRRYATRQRPAHIWIGVSCEDQKAANALIPDLLATWWAAPLFVSLEPLLDAIDLNAIVYDQRIISALTGEISWRNEDCWDSCGVGPKLAQVIVGGESGPRARPLRIEWVRSLRDQSAGAGTAFFFKQWGEWVPEGYPGEDTDISRVWRVWHNGSFHLVDDVPPTIIGDRESEFVARVGKHRAGRELDGVVHNGMPAS